MNEFIFQKTDGNIENHIISLRSLLDKLKVPFRKGNTVAIKLHWGERGNTSYLPPHYAREIVEWLKKDGTIPLVFDTTVLPACDLNVTHRPFPLIYQRDGRTNAAGREDLLRQCCR